MSWVIHIPVNAAPDIRTVETLEQKQALVGGLIQCVDCWFRPPRDDEPFHFDMWVNEEGLNLGLRPNPVASIIARQFIFGDVFISGPADLRGNMTDYQPAIFDWVRHVDDHVVTAQTPAERSARRVATMSKED